MSLDLIPMVVLSLLLMSAGGGVETVELVLEGTHEATSHRRALIVGDADTTVPADASVPGPIHVLGGETVIHGTVEGDVTLIAGRLVVADGSRITGTLQHIGGTVTVEDGAAVARRTSIEVVPDDPGPAQRFFPMALATALLAVVGARRARRNPQSLAHMRDAVGRHPVISLTVGGLIAVTFLSVFVFMAFTLVLIPVSLLGLAVGVILVGYGVIALGSLVAQRLPIQRPRLATAAGVTVVMIGLQLLGAVPVVGDTIVIIVLLASFGAVLLTYVGLKRFTPAVIPE